MARPDVMRKATDTAVPWAVAAIALVALTALVAGRQFRGNSNSGPVTSLSAATTPGGRAPDISQMTPAERAESLRDRIVRLAEAGRADSVRFFAPMAIASYQMIESITDDQRFDLGRIAILAGVTGVARAQADTILSKDPADLLGLTLAISAARADGNAPVERTMKTRLLAASDESRGRRRPRDQRYQAEIDAAVTEARQ